MTRLLLVGGDSTHNLGDRAILAAMAAELARAAPTIELTAVSRANWRAPLPSSLRTLIPPGTAGLRRLWAAARASRAVVIHGGGLFQDDDSRIKMPYWAARIAALKSANRRVLGHAIGCGPLDHPESRAAARLACRQLRSLSVRDDFARRALTPCTHRALPVVPDPAFMLAPAPANEARDFLRQLGLRDDQPLIGVALRRWFHTRGGFVPHRLRSTFESGDGSGAVPFNALLERLADAIGALARRLDAQVLLLPTYNVPHEADDRASERLAARLGKVPVRLARIDDPALYKAVTGQLILLVSARMHPLILAAGMGVPLVALAYNGKFQGLFDLLGLPPRLAWLDDFRPGGTPPDLESLLAAAMDNSHDVAERAASLAARSRAAVAALLHEAGVE